jgi:hypothetical protein
MIGKLAMVLIGCTGAAFAKERGRDDEQRRGGRGWRSLI